MRRGSGVTQHQLVQSLPSITLAVIAAFCFAGAAVLQHRAVSAEPDPGSSPLSLRGLRDVSRRPGWQLGLVLAAGGSTLHAVALVLAPLSVVQPIGVLAVPIAVVLSGARTHRRPTPGMLVGVIVCVTAVVTFVGTAAGSAVSTPAPGRAMLLAGLVVGLVVLVLAGVGLARIGWARCVTCAMAGAAAFGLVSALVRAASQAVTSGQVGILDPEVLTTVAGVAAAILGGGWLIQQAFASGPPEVVVACLTVVDPIVAVLFGVVLLGEGNATSSAHWAVLGVAAFAATVGVGLLARHHPEATTRTRARHRLDPAPRLPRR
jgi:hypothetical protein